MNGSLNAIVPMACVTAAGIAAMVAESSTPSFSPIMAMKTGGGWHCYSLVHNDRTSA